MGRARRGSSESGNVAALDPKDDPVDDRVDDDVAEFVADLRRCTRRQLWTVIIGSTIAIVVFSAIFGALLAAHAEPMITPVFSLIAVSVCMFGMLRTPDSGR